MRYLTFTFAVLMLCGLARGQEASVATPTPTPLRKSSVAGRVVLAGAGTPLPRVQVLLTDSIRYENRRTVTDAQGQFVFKDLAAGHYHLETRAPGYWPSAMMKQFRAVLPKEGGVRPGNVSREPSLKLADFEQKEVTLELEAGGSITGRATFDDGEPLVDIRLGVWRELAAGTFLALPMEVGYTRTDDRGVYRLVGLPEGRYLIGLLATSQARRYGPSNETALVYYPSAHSYEEAEIVTVTSGGEVTGINLKVITARRRLAGVVKPPAGKHLVNAHVIIERKTEKTDDTKANPEVFRANYALKRLGEQSDSLQPVKTQQDYLDNEENWSFKDLPPGDYRVSVTARLTPQSVWLTRPQIKPGAEHEYYEWYQKLPKSELHKTQEVSLRDGDATEVVLELSEGGSLSGFVQGVNGVPAVVTAYRKWLPGESPLYEKVSAQVQPDGAFTINGLDPAEYWIGAYIGNVPEEVKNRYYLQQATLGAQDLTKEWLILPPQKSISDVSLVFASDAATLQGRVTHRSGENAFQARVCQARVKPGDPDWYCYNANWQGTFQAVLPPGEYIIFPLPISAGNAQSFAELMQRAAANAQRITLQPGQKHDIELTLPK